MHWNLNGVIGRTIGHPEASSCGQRNLQDVHRLLMRLSALGHCSSAGQSSSRNQSVPAILFEGARRIGTHFQDCDWVPPCTTYELPNSSNQRISTAGAHTRKERT